MGANPIRYLGGKVNHQGINPPKGSDYFVVALCGAKEDELLRSMSKVTCKKCLKLMQDQGGG